MAQTSLNSTGVASSGALSLQSNGTTEAIGISTGQVATLAQNPILTSGTANGVGYLNGSKVLTTGSALVFDGTTFGVGTALTNGTKANVMGGDNVPATSGSTQNGGLRVSSLSSGNGGYVLDMGVSNTNGYAWMQVSNSSNLASGFTKDLVINPVGGNLGLGVTPPTGSGTYRAFNVGAALMYGNSALAIASYASNADINDKYIISGNATSLQQYQGAFKFLTAASGTAGNAITFTQAMTLDASGNLGIGTSSPSEKLNISGGSGITRLKIDSTASVAASLRMTTTNDSQGYINYDTGNWIFFNNSGGSATERARILSSGSLLVGRTTVPTYTDTTGFGFAYDRPNQTTFFVTDQATSVACTYFNATSYTSGTAYFAQFRVNGATKGEITSNGTTTTYSTSSDYRLKENIASMTGALDTVAQLKPCTYTWKSNGSSGQGFIAHELQAVVPDAVVGSKDAVDDDGNPKYQGIDTSFLVATLTAAIQELNAKFEAYKATHP
jgi:hypothetical protein